MASVDVKWPSEDEEFDTVNSVTKTKTENKPEENTGGENIAVSTGQNNTEEHNIAPEAPESAESSGEPQAESTEETTEQAPAEAENAPEAEENPEGNPELVAAAQAEETPEASKPQEPVLPESETPVVTDKDPNNELAKLATVAAAVPAAKVAAGKRKSNIGHVVAHVVLLALVAGLAFWAFGMSSENKDLKNKVITLEGQVATLSNNPAIIEQRKTDELVNKVGTLVELPQNERPQAALVSDAASLKKQYPFFANVTNGDQILFYYQTGKVFVYRPSTNKVVQSGPLTISQNAPAAAATTRR